MKKILSILFVFLFMIFTSASQQPQDHKIDICHATSDHENPYVGNNVDKNATAGGHSDHIGPIWFDGITTSWGDIIPSYDYDVWEVVGSELQCPNNYSESTVTCPGRCQKDAQPDNPDKCVDKESVDLYDWVTYNFPGLNWNVEGQAIWNNSCQVAEPTPPPNPPYFNIAACYWGDHLAKFGYLANDLPDPATHEEKVTPDSFPVPSLPFGTNTTRVWSSELYPTDQGNIVLTVKIEGKTKTATIGAGSEALGLCPGAPTETEEPPTPTPTPVVQPEVSTGGGAIGLLIAGLTALGISLIGKKRK